MKTIRLCNSRLLTAGWRSAALLAVLVCARGAAAADPPTQKKYYLTPGFFQANTALSACESGFHMASIFELLDFGSLRYETKLGHNEDDSGSGPPAERGGWIRTGRSSDARDFEGTANCEVWTSSLATDYGTVVEIESRLGNPAEVSSPFDVGTLPCDQGFRVWCKQN